MRSTCAEHFADWRLAVDGLVARPLSIPIQTLRALPHRTQITRHDCVEGWSAIGKWHGVPLSLILDACRAQHARANISSSTAPTGSATGLITRASI